VVRLETAQQAAIQDHQHLLVGLAKMVRRVLAPPAVVEPIQLIVQQLLFLAVRHILLEWLVVDKS